MAETEAIAVTGPVTNEGPGPPIYSGSPGSDSLDPRVQVYQILLNLDSSLTDLPFGLVTSDTDSRHCH